MGDKYAVAFAEGLQQSQPRKLFIGENRLSKVGSVPVLKQSN